jgi:RNA polymerase sigma-70 factor (ECF subfamily)
VVNQNPDIHTKLIEQCRKGDSRSQYRLYKLYAKAMYNIAMRMLANKMDAEDVMQEAFVNAFRKIDDYRQDASFGAWLKKIVINHCINFMQRKRSFFESLDESNVDAKDDTGETENYAFPPELIHESLKLLPEGSRVILNLHLFEGYKHREIAQMLEISESTSKTQYQRAKILLKERLLQYEQQV